MQSLRVGSETIKAEGCLPEEAYYGAGAARHGRLAVLVRNRRRTHVLRLVLRSGEDEPD